jgi:hypothetical protein
MKAIGFAALALLLSPTVAVCQGAGSPRYTVNHVVKWQTGTVESTKSFASIPDAKEMVLDDDGRPATYSYAYEDLKGDGKKELIIQAGGMTWCGSAGCLTTVLEQRDGKWVSLLSETIGEEITVLNEKVNGYAYLRAGFGDGMQMKPHVFALKLPDVKPSLLPGAAHSESARVLTNLAINHKVQFIELADDDKKSEPFKQLPILSPYFTRIRGDLLRSFAYAVEDLKGDGSQYLIFQARDTTLCSRDGCVTWILEARGDQFVEIFSMTLGPDMYIMNEKVNGYFAIQAPYQQAEGVLQPKIFTLGPGPLKTTDAHTWGDIGGQLTVARGGEAVPLVSTTVTATNVQTGEAVHALTGKDGWFAFHNLIPDFYEVAVQLPGHDPAKQWVWLNGVRGGPAPIHFDFDK